MDCSLCIFQFLVYNVSKFSLTAFPLYLTEFESWKNCIFIHLSTAWTQGKDKDRSSESLQGLRSAFSPEILVTLLPPSLTLLGSISYSCDKMSFDFESLPQFSVKS